MNADPQWLAIARPLVGLHEIHGAEHSPEILGMWRAIKRSGIQSDEVPWCAAFVGACLERAGIRSSRFESAASYLDWGVRLDGPAQPLAAALQLPQRILRTLGDQVALQF